MFSTAPSSPANELPALSRRLLQGCFGDAMTLLPLSRTTAVEDFRRLRTEPRIVVCDFPLAGIEDGERVTGGYERSGILNVDHHAPTRDMQRRVSSTNLAAAHVRQFGPVPSDVPIFINHTDTDSLLSALIMRGVLPPLEIFEAAAIAADHTGAENQIADLLQALENERNIEMSIRNLGLLLSGEELEPRAAELLADRMQQRALAASVIEKGQFLDLGSVVLVRSDITIGGELLTPLFPKATLVVGASPFALDPRRWHVKVRLGQAAADGMTLFDLDVPGAVPGFGGRWNAGSNERGGGCLQSPLECAQALLARLTAAVAPDPR